MNLNPVLSEIQGLSPAAKGALGMAGHTLPPDPSQGVAPVITPQMKASVMPQDAGPAPVMSSPHMESPAPILSAPSSNVSGPILGTTQGDTLNRQGIMGSGAGVENIAKNIEGTGFGQRHPLLGKLLGGITEGEGLVGDTLLHAASPGIERAVPGTEGNYTRELGRSNAALTQDTTNEQKEAQTASENATAGKTNAETPEVVPEAQARIGQENATASEAPSVIAEHNAQAAALLHPQAKTDFEAWQAQNPGKPIADWIKLSQKPATIPPEQQYLTEYANAHPGSTVAQAERQYMLDTQRPTQASPVNLFVPGATPGTETLQTVRPGQTVAAGAQTAAGVNAVNTPTTQQRTAAGRAQTVLEMAPSVIGEVQRLAPKLGPIAGRWNDFMQGKVGMDDPDFAGLRTDMVMFSSAVALAHAQGRLPENLRQEFDHMINAPQQTPENIISTMQHILPWLEKMQQQGQPNSGKGGAPPTRPAGVPDNYQWNAQGNGGKGSWRAPQ